MRFMTAGDAGYFFLILENCSQVRVHYPDSHILVYDFGLTDNQRKKLTQKFSALEIIDWRSRLNDYPNAWKQMPEMQKRKLTLAFNARKTGWRKRLKKAIFKRFPNSSFANSLKHKALLFENILIQKIACMRDASERVGNERLIFLDADAMLFKAIDDAFDDSSDVTFTLTTKPLWDYNACFIINSGVIYFSANKAIRNTLLDAWWAEAQQNEEWLREQSALVRMIERTVPRSEFTPGNNVIATLTDNPVRIHFESCDEFNFFDMENVEPEDFPEARIYHFTGRRQQPEMFTKIMSYLRAHH